MEITRTTCCNIKKFYALPHNVLALFSRLEQQIQINPEINHCLCKPVSNSELEI